MTRHAPDLERYGPRNTGRRVDDWPGLVGASELDEQPWPPPSPGRAPPMWKLLEQAWPRRAYNAWVRAGRQPPGLKARRSDACRADWRAFLAGYEARARAEAAEREAAEEKAWRLSVVDRIAAAWMEAEREQDRAALGRWADEG